MPLSTFLWGSTARQITTVCAMIAAIGGAIVAVPPAWDAMALPEIASRMFVLQTVKPIKDDAAAIHLAQIATTKAIQELTVIQLQSQLYQAEKDRSAAPSPTVDQQITTLTGQIQSLQSKINAPQPK